MIYIFHSINGDDFYKELKGDTFNITAIKINREKKDYRNRTSSIYVSFKIETDQNDCFEMGIDLNISDYSYDNKINDFCILSKNEKIRLYSDKQVLKWIKNKMEEKTTHLVKQLEIKKKIDEINNEFAE